MTNCAKCGAELIGKKKFCAACGSPVADPRAPSGSTSGGGSGGAGSAPGNYGGAPAASYGAASSGGAPPPSNVNPFAETAFPSKKQRDSQYGPPPGPVPAAGAPAGGAQPPPPQGARTPTVNDQAAASHVSPLAVSNVVSQRGAYDQAVQSASAQSAIGAASAPAVASVPPQESSAARPIPGTQLMPSVANPQAAPVAPAPSVAKPQQRTQLMGAFPVSASSAAPAASSATPHSAQPSQHAPAGPIPPPAAPAPMPQAHNLAVPSPGAAFVPAGAAPGYGNPYGAAPYGVQHPQPAPPTTAPQWGGGWNAAGQPPQPPQAPQGFGYAPGARVVVTWSNGQRYPGTVQQTSGTQCLVVFPDGQQHWVEMHYVAPG